MEALNLLWETFENSVERDDFVKFTLSKPLRKSEELQNVYIRLIYIKNQPTYSFTYRYKTRDEVKNYNFEEAKKHISELLENQFRAATFFCLQEDLMVFVSKKKLISFKTVPATFSHKPPEVHDRPKEKKVETAPYLVELGIMTASGDLIPKMADKYRQINKFLEIVEAQIKETTLPQSLHIVDMGCGKGYLTFALYDYLKNKGLDVSVVGIELRQHLVDFCNGITQKCNYTGLNFVAQPIEEFDNDKIDILIALHACDVATDYAIAKGIQAKAQLIIVAPCCHKQLRQQTKNLTQSNILMEYGIYKERMFEMITDTLRSLIMQRNQYQTKIFEFISGEHTAKNIMLVGIRDTKKPNIDLINHKIQALKTEFQIEYQELERLV